MPLEDFTTYTEYDLNSHIGKTANHVDFQCYRNETAYLYKDYGAEHFDDFEHLLTVKAVAYGGSGTGQSNIFWVLCNTQDEDYTGNAVPFINLFFYWNGTNVLLFLREKHSGGINQDSFTAGWNTPYYLTTKKDGTALTCKIYSDASRTNLLDTLSITLQADHKWCYLYIAQSSHETYAQWLDADFDNLDLQEGAAVVKEVADSLSLVEAVLRNKTLAVSDSVGVAEAPLKDWTSQISDAVTLLDVVLRGKQFSVLESLSLSELVTVFTGVVNEVADSVGLSDTAGLDKVLSLSDQIQLADNVYVSKILVVSDQASLIEVVEKTVAGAVKTRVFLVLGDLAIQLTRE